MKKNNVFTSALALGVACTAAISTSIVMPAGAIADDVTIDSDIAYVYGCDAGDVIESYAIDGTVFDRVTVTENMLDSGGYAEINAPYIYNDIISGDSYDIPVCIKNITTGNTRCTHSSTVTFSNLKADAVVLTDSLISDYGDVKSSGKLISIEDYNEMIDNYDGSYFIDYYVTFINNETSDIISQERIMTSTKDSIVSFDSFGIISDVNTDGKVDFNDIYFIRDWLLGEGSMTPLQYTNFMECTGNSPAFNTDYFGANFYRSYFSLLIPNYNFTAKEIIPVSQKAEDSKNTIPDFISGEDIDEGFYLSEVHTEENGEFELKVFYKTFNYPPLVNGYDFQISYDPDVMFFEEGDLSNLITTVGDGYDDIYSAYSIDNEKGVFTCYDANPLGCADGNEDGVLLTLKGTLKDSAKFGDVIPISIGPVERDFNFISLGSRNYFQSGYVVVDKSTSSTHITKIKGDVNFDAEVSVADVVAISSYVGNPTTNSLDAYAISNGDVHNVGDGLSANDALMIQQYLVGVIDAFDTE